MGLCALLLAACENMADTGMPSIPLNDGANKVEDTNISATEIPKDGAIEISFEILSDTRTDLEGNELLYAQYPVFSVSGEGYEALQAAFDAWNKEFKSQANSFLDEYQEDAAQYRESVDASYQYSQKIYVSIPRCDQEFVSLLISREVEEGGPHPNNYPEAFNFFSQTGELAKLSDVVTVDDALREKIKEGLHTDYPELEFDDAVLEQEIADALANETVEWYFTDKDICISFQEGSFGFGHAEGSLGVLVPAGIKD